MEKTLKLSLEEWEGANYIKGKERNFQAKRTESTNILWQKRAWYWNCHREDRLLEPVGP